MWRIELLGEPRVVGSDHVISRFESKRVVALLAYLALFPDTRHPREVLTDRLWPEASLEAGRNRLKQALASLRRQLEPPGVAPGSVLSADRNNIGLQPGSFVCDVDEFRSTVLDGDFEKARNIRRGELMPGFYDEWLEDVRLQLSAFEADLEGFQPEPKARQDSQSEPDKGFEVRLPATITTFIGREKECDQVLAALNTNRLVSVTGFGGLGKTRLNLQVASLWQRGDVWYAPMALAHDASEVLPMIAKALRLDVGSGTNVLEAIKSSVRNRPTLLVLDNMEHLIGLPTREALSQLLSEVSELRVLVSSRVPLKVEGEVEFSLWPLEVPDSKDKVEELSRNPAVRLFIDRARQARPDFQVTRNNSAQVVKVCQQLEGIPLAIELCATWAHYGMARILELLDAGTGTLESRQKNQNDRHVSLSHVFETTVSALKHGAQFLLAQISVFRSGFDWEMVEAVCAPGLTLVDLSELIEASLVRPVYDSDPPRFVMLESLRQMSQGLLAHDESAQINERFADYFCRLAAASAQIEPIPNRSIQTQSDWIEFFLKEWSNMRAAATILKTTCKPEKLLDLLLDTEWYWSAYAVDDEFLRNMIESCNGLVGRSSHLARLLSLSHLMSGVHKKRVDEAFQEACDELRQFDDPLLIADCKLRWAKVKLLRQDMTSIGELAQQSRQVFAGSGLKVQEGQSLHILANCAIQNGDSDTAIELLAKSEACFRKCGSQVNLAAVTYTRARHLYMQQRFEDCLAALFVCRDAARGLHNMRSMGRTANLFGVVLRNLKQEQHARVYLYLSFVASEQSRDVRGAHMPLWNLFLSLGSEGRWEDAVAVMAYAMAIWNDYYCSALDASDQQLLDNFIQGAKGSLGSMKFAELQSQGNSWNLEKVGHYLKATLAEELAVFSEEVQSFF